MFTSLEKQYSNWRHHSTYNSLKVLSMIKDEMEINTSKLDYKVEYRITKNT